MFAKCLSIAGFDSSGGAGIQADLKTFAALGCYGMSVLTALPIQNTSRVRKCYEIPLQAIAEQLSAVFEDIVPDSIKIGMLFSAPIIELVADFLKAHAVNIPIILDPVMVAKSGDPLLQLEAMHTLKSTLIPLATLITPNLPEAQQLVGVEEDMEQLSLKLLTLGAPAVLLKGGHCAGTETIDLFKDITGHVDYFSAPRIYSKNTHGTGCTLAAAICAFTAQGFSLVDSCRYAKRYLQGAIQAAREQSVGKGAGPVHHFYHIWPTLDEFTRD